MRNSLKLLMLFAIVIAFSSCSSLRTASDFDKTANFGIYKTYNFYDKGLTRLRMNNLDKRRMMAAVEADLNAKGFTKAAKPDLLVNLVVVARERTDVYNYGPGFYGPGWGWGWGWGGWGGGAMTNVNQFMEGTVIIDFLDPKSKTLVWHGRGSGFNLDNLKNREERLNKGISEILAQYPPAVASK
ncbi:DUF4136 domain-containing protein [Pedobacter aquatilis]|uniref:DUF4136 domain-containing protein n=1 Tax=Pedobacter aquatilis TaxID=351343 RepID=UPI00292F1DEF|nr:DUF4136 domain-containing protein [Pedobacter aquatilis]